MKALRKVKSKIDEMVITVENKKQNLVAKAASVSSIKENGDNQLVTAVGLIVVGVALIILYKTTVSSDLTSILGTVKTKITSIL